MQHLTVTVKHPILRGMTNTNIPNGTLVRLPDGSTALAYHDTSIGRPWAGRYRTAQRNAATGGDRVDAGWRRDQLTVI